MLYEALSARGHNVWLGCPPGRPLHQYGVKHDFNLVPLEFNSKFRPVADWKDVLELRRVMREQNIDVVHLHRGKDHWTGAVAAHKLGIPVVRTRHVVVPVRQHAPNRWLWRKRTRGLISVSRAARGSLGALVNEVAHEKVILSAVDLEKFNSRHRSEEWRQSQPVSKPDEHDGELVWLGLIGRLQRIKGQEVFLEAVSEVAKECPNARFLITGRGGAYRLERYREYAKEHGFDDRLVTTGELENLPEVMASLDVGVIASRGSEASSRVCLEFMASGVGVVATRVGGIPELLAPRQLEEAEVDAITSPRSDHNGWLVPPKNPKALAKAMIGLINDKKERERLAAAGRHCVTENHSIDRWAEQMEGMYRTVIEEQQKQ